MLRRQTHLPKLQLFARFFSSSSLNQPGGISGDELLSNIKSSHQATAGLRFAESQRRQEEEAMTNQHQKYRDGLVNPNPQETISRGVSPFMVKSFQNENRQQQQQQQQQQPSGKKDASSSSSSSRLHFEAPSNPLTIGRDPLILSLWQSILSGRRALFLSGADGMGASTVASQFAEHARRSGRFSCIQWFDCSRTVSNAASPSSSSSTTFLATSIREPALEQLKRFVKEMRTRNEDEALLVFDHCENPAEILQVLHGIFVAMKQHAPSSSSSTSTDASSSQFLFSGPPKLAEADSRSHYSRLHLLFVVPQKRVMNEQGNFSIVSPIDELLQIPVSDSHLQQQQQNEANAKSEVSSSSHSLASEFCPVIFNVQVVDEVPSMLLSERLIQSNISEYHHNQEMIDNNLAVVASSDQQEQLLPPPPALFDTHLLALCDRVARVPLLLILASQFVAVHLLKSDRMKELTKQGEVLVGEDEEALFQQIIDEQLTHKTLGPAMKNKTEENPEGVLSISSAAAALCLGTLEAIVGREQDKSKIIITKELVESVIFSLVKLNVSDLSHALIEGLIVETIKNDSSSFSAASSFISSSSANREQVVNEIELILRRCGFLTDSLVLDSGGSKIENFSKSKTLDEETYSCHVALADGLLLLLQSSSSPTKSTTTTSSIMKALLNLFIKAKARNDFYAQLRISRHVQAFVLHHNNNSNQNEEIISTFQRDLFDRVALFQSQIILANQKRSPDTTTQVNFVRQIWTTAFNGYLLERDSIDNNEAAARIGRDLGRLILSPHTYRRNRMRQLEVSASPSISELNQLREEETEQEDFIFGFLEQASDLALLNSIATTTKTVNKNNNNNNWDQIIASKNVVWAEITALRATSMDPEKEETLSAFSAAAQILENCLMEGTNNLSSSSNSNSDIRDRDLMIREAHYVVLVAWTECAKILKKKIPDQHWTNMNRARSLLPQQQQQQQERTQK
jgi:hypothetical protein